MDKLTTTWQATPVSVKADESVSTWYATEVTSGLFAPSEIAWLHAAGWTTSQSATVNGTTLTSLQRRIIKPEEVLQALVTSYTSAYNEGRQLNDQRYDDLLVLYASILDKTEDSYNTLETGDDAYGLIMDALFTSIGDDYTAYSADVDGDLDDWGTGLNAEINARFDAELSKGQQSLVDRGMCTATMWVTMSAGIERERTRALNDASDQITQRQTELKHKLYVAQASMRDRLLAARERLRTWVHGNKDRQVAVRNSAAEAIGRVVEGRTDSYPDIAEVGKLSASLGAGSGGYRP